MTTSSKLIVFTAVVVICIAVIMSAIFTRNRKQNRDLNRILTDMDKKEVTSQNPFPSRKPDGPAAENTKTARKSWASTFLPFYSLGIIAYVMFVVGKIMNKKSYTAKKKRDFRMSWTSQSPPKGKSKTKITMFEINQLEDRLKETEQAVQHILTKANFSIGEVTTAVQRMEEESSEDEFLYNVTKRAKKSCVIGDYRDANKPLTTEWTYNGENRSPMCIHDNQEIQATIDSKRAEPSSVLRRRRYTKNSESIQEKETALQFSSEAPKLGNEDWVHKQRFLAAENAETHPCQNTDDISDWKVEEKMKTDGKNVHGEQYQLLQTAIDIRETMTEMKNYIEERKSREIDLDG